MLNLLGGPRRWKVSAAWFSKQFNCTLDHIVSPDGCAGSCCHNNSTWPTRAYDDGKCGFLGETGCLLPMEQRPITCILFPVTFIKSPIESPDDNTFVLWQRSIFPHSMCKGAYRNGPPLIDTVEESLVLIFGRDEYERVRSDVMSGNDSHFVITDEILTELQRDVSDDNYSDKVFTKPVPRDYPTKG